MTTRKITMLALVGGIALGGAATEGVNVYRQSQDSYRQSQASHSFQQRVRCKAVADAYVKENTHHSDNSVSWTIVALEKVDFSPGRNSCVAELETVGYLKGEVQVSERVADLLSGETLFRYEAGASRLVILPRVWDYVLNNADEPVALEKEYVQMQSALAPKATASASSVAEPNDWQTVAVPGHDAQGKPIASPLPPGAGKQYYDPVTGERIQAPASQKKTYLDPNTGEPIPSSKSPPSGFIPDPPASQHK